MKNLFLYHLHMPRKMAGLAVRFTVLVLLITFSQARFIQEQDVTPEETVNELPESDPKTANAILLPSERPGFEPAKVVDFKHDDASETNSDVDSAALTMISFRPINRHFPRRAMIPYRHKHNCRFHKQFRFRPLKPRFQQKRYVSYGDDMILADERTRFDAKKSAVVRQIQARWARFPDETTGSNEALDFIKPYHHDHEHEYDHDHDEDHHHFEHEHDHDEHLHHHRRRRHHHHEEEGNTNEREEHGQENKGWFMESFRKLFDLF